MIIVGSFLTFFGNFRSSVCIRGFFCFLILTKDSICMYGIKTFLSGQFIKKHHVLIYGLSVLFLFCCFYVISYLYFPNYTMITNFISQLGLIELNPKGWYFWDIAMGCAGLFVIPLINYMRHRLIIFNKLWTQIGYGLFISHSIGMIGLGIFPQFEIPVFRFLHILNAVLGLGGLYFGVICWGIPLIIALQRKLTAISPIGYGIYLFLTSGTPLGFGLSRLIQFLGLDSIYLSFSLWEWILFIGILAAFVSLWMIVAHTHKNTSKSAITA